MKQSTLRDNSCKHFCGFREETCEAGVRFLDLVGGKIDGMAIRLPCSGHFATPEMRAKHPDLTPVACAKFQKKTAEEIQKEHDDIQALVDRMTKIGPWISATKKKYPNGGQAEESCPICAKRIRFSISSCNGHMHARCETEDCINFME